MSETFKPTTPPGTPERIREVQEHTARQIQAATDKLLLTLRDNADEARRFIEGIKLVESAFDDTIEP